MSLRFDFAMFLIENGADVDRWDLYGQTPLYVAVDMNTLPKGGRPDIPSEDFTTGLQVAEALLQCLPECSIRAIAAALGVSGRVLQSRLRKGGCTYRDILLEVRMDLAREYLAHSAMTLGEISFCLGFSEPSAFQRAFKSTTGETPARFRSLNA